MSAKISFKLKTILQNTLLLLTSTLSKSKDKVSNDVPYTSQFADPLYAEKVLKDKMEITTDKKWPETGAESIHEYTKWVLTICGMACTAMSLKFLKGKDYKIIDLAKDALKHNVYKQSKDEISDMHYMEYADWIKSYGLKAEVYSKLNVRGIRKLLSDAKLVMVSVNPNIRGHEIAKKTQKGGHLVLVTGYDKTNNTITLHNPSGFTSSNTQTHHTLPVPELRSYYAGRGIGLSSIE